MSRNQSKGVPVRVLVTGGAGYIGSHTCVELLAAGHEVTVYDNLCNSSPTALERVQSIAKRPLSFVCGDIRDTAALESALRRANAEAVIHFAGLKAVGESAEKPIEYYDNNVSGTVSLLKAMTAVGLWRLVFSSSATVYGDPQALPLVESHPLSATNPYGRSKLMIEEMLRDIASSQPRWRMALLRYFNPVGAHPSGSIGEDPRGVPNNLLPFVAQVAVGRREFLNVWGNDYDTPDGTGVRDYIHVVDLACGHLRALDALDRHTGALAINLGTGRGYSVLDVVRAFERASGKAIAFKIAPRRQGDVAACYANPDYAHALLGWRAQFDLNTMCADAWRWQSNNPNGFQ